MNTGVTVTGSSVTVGQARAYPEVIEIATTAGKSAVLSGFYDVRFCFKGQMRQVVADANSIPITVTISAGGRSMTSTTSFLQILTPGVTILVGDEELFIESISSDGLTAVFTPYHSHHAVTSTMFITDTFVGCASPVIIGSLSLEMYNTLHYIAPGDNLLVTSFVPNGLPIEQVVTVESISGTTVTLTDQMLWGSSYDIAVYRQAN
eukprot:gene35845-58856_t